MLSEGAIRRLIQEGENESVEFKVGIPPEDVIGKLLSAFGNTNGGFIILGVSDKKEIVGLNVRTNMAVYHLRRVVKSVLPMSADVDSISIDGKEVIVIEIPKILPAYLPVMTSAGVPYIRIGDSIAVMPIGQLYAPIFEKIKTSEPVKSVTKKPPGTIKIFVAMSFRNEEEPSLQDYWNAIKRAKERVEIKDLEIKRIDLNEGDFEISQQIMNDIIESDIIIADFTLSPRNVYFELGYARGRNKIVIQTARQGEKLEFDIRNWKTTFYRNATELEEKIFPEIKHAYELAKK